MFRFERVCSKLGFRGALVALALVALSASGYAAAPCGSRSAQMFHQRLLIQALLALPEDVRLVRYVESLFPYSERRFIDNVVWINDVLLNPASQKELCFTVDSVLLGQIHSKVTQTHEGATAAVLLLQRYFGARLEANPILQGVVGRSNLLPSKTVGFRNAKTITLVLREDTPAIREAVSDAFLKALNDFAADIRSLKLIDEKVIEVQKGPLARPEQWFFGAFGRGPHDSNMNARDMRRSGWAMSIGSDQRTEFTHDVTPYRVKNAKDAEVRRKAIVAELEKGFGDRLVSNFGGTKVPSLRVLKALRKVRAEDQESYKAVVRKEIGEPSLTDDQIIALRDYNRLVSDYLTTEPYSGDWDPIVIESRDAGAIFYDMDGLAAEDIQSAMLGVSRANLDDREDITKSVYKATLKVTNKIRDTTARIRNAIEWDGESFGEHQAVGDEGIIYPTAVTDASGRALFYRRIAIKMRQEKNNRSGQIKWVYVKGSRMKGWTRESLSPAEMDRYMTAGMDALRFIKKGLVAKGHSEEFVENFFFPLEYLPRDQGVDVNLCLPRLYKGDGDHRKFRALKDELLGLYRAWQQEAKVTEIHDLHIEYF